jgi:hypothetical protein
VEYVLLGVAHLDAKRDARDHVHRQRLFRSWKTDCKTIDSELYRLQYKGLIARPAAWKILHLRRSNA